MFFRNDYVSHFSGVNQVVVIHKYTDVILSLKDRLDQLDRFDSHYVSCLKKVLNNTGNDNFVDVEVGGIAENGEIIFVGDGVIAFLVLCLYASDFPDRVLFDVETDEILRKFDKFAFRR